MTRKLQLNLRRATLAVATGTTLLTAAALRAEGVERPSFNLTADVADKYVWRGMLQNEDPVVQPSATVSWKGLSLNLWGSIDTTRYGSETSDVTYGDDRQGQFEEVDYTLSYTYGFDQLSLTGGVIHYTFPGSPLWDSTSELFAKAALTKVPLTPTLSVYGDIKEVNGVYANLSVSQPFTLVEDKLTLTLGAGLGWGDTKTTRGYYAGSTIDRPAFSDASVSATLDYKLSAAWVLSGYAIYSDIVDPALAKVRDDLADSGSALAVLGLRVSCSF